MKKKRKFSIVGISVFVFIIVCLSIGYIIYGSTLVNLNDESSISDYLAADKSKPINILETAVYGDYVGILYTDSVDAESGCASDYAHFVALTKHKFYKNRYLKKGSNYGNFTQPNCYEISNSINELAVYFIFDISRNETKCSVFEADMTLMPLRKIDEFNIPQSPYIIVKEYKLENEYNSISTYNGSVELNDLIGE